MTSMQLQLSLTMCVGMDLNTDSMFPLLTNEHKRTELGSNGCKAKKSDFRLQKDTSCCEGPIRLLVSVTTCVRCAGSHIYR